MSKIPAALRGRALSTTGMLLEYVTKCNRHKLTPAKY
jgi:hypothetical protein